MTSGNSSNRVSNVFLDDVESQSLNANEINVNSLEVMFKQSSPLERVEEEIESPPYWIVVGVYFSYYVLVFFGNLRDFLQYFGMDYNGRSEELNREGFVSINKGFDSFYFRNIFMRERKIFHNPICSVPSAIMKLKKEVAFDNNLTSNASNRTLDVINMGSYDYLGFADNSEKGTVDVKNTIEQYGTTLCSSRQELGTADLHLELERMIAEFVGTEDSIALGMGFATNSTVIPSLVSKGCLIFSDELNHSSIILGCRLSGAKIKVFKHNSMKYLEELIRSSIVEGQPRTHRTWRKIIIISEGIYSVDGTICNLPALIALKNKYKCYLYIDEAHSIGVIGSRGRGVVDYFGCDPKDVDLLMGTFSMSFNSFGGYIAGSKKLIHHLRIFCPTFIYSSSISPPYASRILTIMRIIHGTRRN